MAGDWYGVVRISDEQYLVRVGDSVGSLADLMMRSMADRPEGDCCLVVVRREPA